MATIRQTAEGPAEPPPGRSLAATSDPPALPRQALEPRVLLGLTSLLAVILGAAVLDLVLDRPGRSGGWHVLIEIVLVVALAGGVVLLGLAWARARGDVRELRSALRSNDRELAAWRERASALQDGLEEALAAQLAAWGLTAAEGAVARWLLGGYSHKEIAVATGRSERTVRQHAAAVYRKSGLGGRAELSAFFLGGLLSGERARDEGPSG